jgi:hypothetical protein
LEVLLQRPPRRDNPIALTGDIVNLKHQLYPGGRHPRGAGIRDWARSILNWLVRGLVWAGWMVLVLVEAAERSC